MAKNKDRARALMKRRKAAGVRMAAAFPDNAKMNKIRAEIKRIDGQIIALTKTT